jgi:hypothetical protein
MEAIVEWWRPRLGLQHWQLTVEWPAERDDDDPDAERPKASTWRARDYDEARVSFDPHRVGDWDRREANVLAVHELLHLPTREVEYVLDLIDSHLHRDSQELVERAHRHAVEGAVDRLAYRLVDLVEELSELPPARSARKAAA